MNTIKPMMKINLTFTARTGPEDRRIPLDHADFEFIFGIGSGGLTPFEYELADRTSGEEVGFLLRDHQRQSFFEHLYPPVVGLFIDYAELFLNARINSIEKAEGREIIKAMAEMTARSEGGGGCGGDCGCGCS